MSFNPGWRRNFCMGGFSLVNLTFPAQIFLKKNYCDYPFILSPNEQMGGGVDKNFAELRIPCICFIALPIWSSDKFVFSIIIGSGSSCS